MKRLEENNAALLIVLTFTLLQFVILAVFGYTPYPDSESYIDIARMCLDESSPYPSPSLINADFVWNVGAINMAELSLWLFKSVTPLLILYTLMKGATAWLVYLIAKRLTVGRAAMIALVLYVIYPSNYGESTSTLSEIPFIFFSLLGVLCVIKGRPCSGGISLALGNWFRPLGIIFVLSCCIFIILKRLKIKRKLSEIVAGYAIALLFIGSLSYFTTNHFIFQAGSGWFDIMEYSWNHDRDKTNEDAALYTSNPSVLTDLEISFDEKESISRKNFFIWLKDNPAEYLYQMKEKFIGLYCSDNVNMCTFIPGKRDKEYMYEEISMYSIIRCFPNYSPVQILTITNLLYYYLLMLLFVVSAPYLIMRKHYDWIVFSVSVTVLSTLMFLFFAHGEARLHNPLMPFIIITNAAFISAILRKNKPAGA